MDRPPYATDRHARLLWQKFRTVITLDRVFRQEGESEDQKRFHQLLINLRDANPTEDD